jgi:hypothetical protein
VLIALRDARVGDEPIARALRMQSQRVTRAHTVDVDRLPPVSSQSAQARRS